MCHFSAQFMVMFLVMLQPDAHILRPNQFMVMFLVMLTNLNHALA
ncbi:hypothetical protein [Vibrio cholerae]|nr:hypothetical protein [Vibrio cholerae]EEO03239.1 hypothetical protein VCA_002242 [Vibrio cholerae VL426]